MNDESQIQQNLELYLYNENNIQITKHAIEKILLNYNYEVKDINLFIEAMTHKSYMKQKYLTERHIKFIIQNIKNKNIEKTQIKSIKNMVKLQDKCYERLEFLGDSIIRLVVTEYLYQRYPTQDEGFLTKLKIKIENDKSLAFLSKTIGLDKYMIIAKYLELNNARIQDDIGILGDVFESFIGALYLDSGSNLSICKPFIINLIETEIDIASLLYNETNYKDMLVKYYHKMRWQDPVYKTQQILEIDLNKKKIFQMIILDNQNKIVGNGEATSKKKGEQIAAKRALQQYGELKCESETSEIEINHDIL